MREHPRLLAGALFGAVAALVILTAIGGCMKTADPLNPSKKITPQQLTTETIDQQTKFDTTARALSDQRAATLADYDAQAVQLKERYATAAQKLTSDTATYNAAVAAYNQKLAAAAADLKDQADKNEKIIELAGGVIQAAGTGTFGPMAALGTTLLGAASAGLVGAWRDSAAKTATLAVKNQQIAQLTTPPTDGGTTATADGAPAPVVLVQATGAAPSLAKAA
jgi:hypothetical protein